MKAERVEHFRRLLMEQLREHVKNVRDDQDAALELSDDGGKDSVDRSLMDVYRELALQLGDRESQMVADIDQALLRIEQGDYGVCTRCGKPIDEKRLETLPWVRYDATCQSLIEHESGSNHNRSI